MAHAERWGFLQRKFVSPGFQGVPDRILKHPNSPVFFIEVKAPGGSVSGAQRREHNRWQLVGVNVYVIFNIGDGIELLDKMRSASVPD